MRYIVCRPGSDRKVCDVTIEETPDDGWKYRIEVEDTGEVIEHWNYKAKRTARAAARRFISIYLI